MKLTKFMMMFPIFAAVAGCTSTIIEDPGPVYYTPAYPRVYHYYPPYPYYPRPPYYRPGYGPVPGPVPGGRVIVNGGPTPGGHVVVNGGPGPMPPYPGQGKRIVVNGGDSGPAVIRAQKGAYPSSQGEPIPAPNQSPHIRVR